MTTGPVTFDQYAPVPNTAAERKAARETGQTAGTEASTAVTEAGLPFVVPIKQADLTNAQLKTILDMQQNARDELKTFEGLETVRTYGEGMRYFATALTVPKGAEGDQDLVVLAAKVQDPTGAIMQGDINRYNNLQVAIEYVPQWMKNEFTKGNAGKFTPETRKRIIAFLRNRVETYKIPYDATRKSFEGRIGSLNEQLSPLGVQPIDINKILPPSPWKLYGPKIEAYDKKMEADRIREDRKRGGPTASLAFGVPEGMQIAGEDVKGWRFSPESEAEIVSYSRKPEATVEGWATLVADKAIAEGHIPPSQRDDYIARNISGSQDFFALPPEERARTRGMDYSEIDKAATENAGLIEGVLQTGRNIPESTAQLFEGLVSISRDTILSAINRERIGKFKTFTDLVAELGGKEGPETEALVEALKERFGSWDAFKRSLIKDPVGVAGDLSIVFTGGGSAASRLPGKFGQFGSAIERTGRVLDPLSGTIAVATEGVPALYRTARERAPGAVTGIEELPTEIIGFPSGTGGAPIREAYGAGFERGYVGAPTPRSEAFTEGMRNPQATGEDLITAAREGISNLREQASRAYTAAMQRFGRNPAPLSIDVVQQRLQRIKPRSYDTWSARKGPRPSEHVAWEQMNDFVNEYAAKAAKDPNLLLPLAMDQFKQDLFDVGSKIGGAYDRNASRIAGTAYNAVRQELVRHDPIYADTMRDYEKAAREAQQLESSFSLAAARGKEPNIDAATRRLQAAIGRNNANVLYGQRAGQVERLNELDPTGTIIPTLSGASLSSWKPRGLNAAVSLGVGLPAAYTNPFALLAAPAFMPRVVGETAYGAGRVAGTGKRAIDLITSAPLSLSLKDVAVDLADLYQKYPTTALTLAQTGTWLEATEAERRRKLNERYSLSLYPAEEMVLNSMLNSIDFPSAQPAPAQIGAPAPVEVPASNAAEEVIDQATGRPMAYNPDTKRYFYTDTGENVPGYAHGGLAHALGRY